MSTQATWRPVQPRQVARQRIEVRKGEPSHGARQRELGAPAPAGVGALQVQTQLQGLRRARGRGGRRIVVHAGSMRRRRCKALRVLDVGSGAGVPAIPWAIMTASVCHFTLVEKVGKKAAFLRRVVHQLNLNSRVTVVEEDVRKLKAQEPYDIICSRAFASLADFIQWTQHLLRPKGLWLYLAGQLDRIAGLKEQHYEHPNADSVIRLVNISPVQLQGQTSSHLVWLSKEGTAC